MKIILGKIHQGTKIVYKTNNLFHLLAHLLQDAESRRIASSNKKIDFQNGFFYCIDAKLLTKNFPRPVDS